MTADASDREAIETLGQRLDQIRDALPAEIAPQLLTVLEQVRAAVDRLRTGDSPQPEAEYDVVRRSIEAMQDLLRNATPESGEPEAPGEDAFILPDLIDASMFMEFLSDQRLRLQELERAILEFEKGDENALAEVKREIHTLKGEAGVLGMDDMQAICHALEDNIEENDIGPAFADRLLEIRDWLAAALDSYAEFQRPTPRAEEMIAGLESGSGAMVPPEEPEAGSPDVSEEMESDEVPTEPVLSVERDGDTVALVGDFLTEANEGLAKVDETLIEAEQSEAGEEDVNRLFRVFHTIKGVASFLELEDVTALAHSTETMMNAVRDGQLELRGEILDLVFDSTAMIRSMLDLIRQAFYEKGSSKGICCVGHARLICNDLLGPEGYLHGLFRGE